MREMEKTTARISTIKGFWRRCALWLVTVGMSTTASLSWSQNFPDKPIRFVVPMAAGGSVDVVARAVAVPLAKRVGQPIVVDNKPGAGGSIAAGFVANASPDGYTVLVADTGQLSINPSLYKKLSYDPSRRFVPITEAVSAPLYLAVNAELPVKSVQELIAYARAAKAPLSFGSVGIGSVHHLAMEMFLTRTNLKMTHIPFKGASQSAVALAAGEVQLAISAMASLRPLIAAGKVRLLAVTSPKRAPQSANVPTIAESGVPGYAVTANVGFVLPPSTPPAIADALYREILSMLDTDEVQTQLTSMGLVMLKTAPAEYAKTIQEDTEKFREAIRITGASAE